MEVPDNVVVAMARVFEAAVELTDCPHASAATVEGSPDDADDLVCALWDKVVEAVESEHDLVNEFIEQYVNR